MISLKQVDTALREIFDETRVQLLDTVYEKSNDGDFYKLVFSIHGLDVELEDDINTIIAHTKIIFRTNLEKTELIENAFWYLKEINCHYNKVSFEDHDGLLTKLNLIINEKSFGDNLSNISNFISEAPASSINDFFNQNDMTDLSVTNVNYNPVEKMTPCKDIAFDFDIEINNGEENIRLTIKKEDHNFVYYYYINDEVEQYEVDEIKQVAQTIGDHLIFLHKKTKV